jgi:hypothetical protein
MARKPQRNRRRYGIDLKNPFTMSKTYAVHRPLIAARWRTANSLLHRWIKDHAVDYVEAFIDVLPVVVEPIGIEPMTSSLQS